MWSRSAEAARDHTYDLIAEQQHHRWADAPFNPRGTLRTWFRSPPSAAGYAHGSGWAGLAQRTTKGTGKGEIYSA